MLLLDTDGEAAKRKQRTTFPLTPLADAMFQLLVFFMLSAGLSPYSLLALQSGTSSDAGDTQQQAPPPPQNQPTEVQVWMLERDRIRSGGQEFVYSQLPDLVAALAANGVAQLVLQTTQDANVQDLAIVLEALETAQISGIQLVRVTP